MLTLGAHMFNLAHLLNKNETLTGVKPQTHQSGRVLSLADILAVGSHNR